MDARGVPYCLVADQHRPPGGLHYFYLQGMYTLEGIEPRTAALSFEIDRSIDLSAVLIDR